jgi:acyl-coenzyme A thioesterase PaaI-like protein
MTLVDAVGMAVIISEALEPIALAATNIYVSFHDGFHKPHVVEEVTDFGNTLATAEVKVVRKSEVSDSDRKTIASGQATARLFDGDD